MPQFNWYKFSELPTELLYAILALRSEIFIVEQQCVYLDIDGEDPCTLHLVGMENTKLVAYLRLFLLVENSTYLKFGRVVTAKSVRGKGYGKILLEEMLTYCEKNFPGTSIKCSAQHHLIPFYETFGFYIQGEPYDEDGILHIDMQKD